MFFSRLRQVVRLRHIATSYRYTFQRCSSYRQIRKPAVFSLALPTFISSFFDRETPEQKCNRLFGEAVSALQIGNFFGAEKLFHATLDQIKEWYDSGELDGKTRAEKLARVYAEMANFELIRQRLPEAEQLFISAMRSAIESGIHETDEMICEMSLKLALIYARTGDHEKAKMGFQHCVDTLKSRLNSSADMSDEKKLNVTALLGMSQNYYAKFLFETGEHTASLAALNESLSICKSIYSPAHPNCLHLLADRAVLEEENDLRQAENTLKTVIQTAEAQISADERSAEELYPTLIAAYLQYAHLKATAKFSKEAVALRSKADEYIAKIRQLPHVYERMKQLSGSVAKVINSQE